MAYNMSHVMRKPAFGICEKNMQISCAIMAQLISAFNFRNIDSTIPLLPKSEISSRSPTSVAVQPGECGTWSEIRKADFVMTWLIMGPGIRKSVSGIPTT